MCNKQGDAVFQYVKSVLVFKDFKSIQKMVNGGSPLTDFLIKRFYGPCPN